MVPPCFYLVGRNTHCAVARDASGIFYSMAVLSGDEDKTGNFYLTICGQIKRTEDGT